MNRLMSMLGLGMRLFLGWWVIGLLAGLLFAGVTGLGAAVLFFPWVAGAVALVGVLKQRWLMRDLAQVHDYGVAHHAVLQAPLEVAEAERETAALMQQTLGADSLSVAGHRIHALFPPPVWSGWWRKQLQADELIVDLRPSSADTAGGSTLEVEAKPLNGIVCGFLHVDGGRNLRRLRRFQEAFAARLAARAKEAAEARATETVEARLAQAELLLLRAQVEPHFLFNTLAHLRELIRTEDAASALAMLDHLIVYARSVSDRIRRATHTLGQELEAAEGYLALMQHRFGSRLSFEVAVEPSARQCEVPVGALLIPVENAIKHGIERRAEGGRIDVRAAESDGRLMLEILDNGPGLQVPSGEGRGTGLANLRERLKLHFAGAARLEVEDRDTGGVCARILLPAERR